jgi:TRAP-type uncharacterized transport system fused permease subunit
MSREEIPPFEKVIRLAPFFLIPFGALLIALLLVGKTPQYAAALAIFASVVLLAVDREWHFSFKDWLIRFLEGSIVASRQIAVIASVIICAGIIIGVLNLTGLGVKITSAILVLSEGQLWIAMMLTALAGLILGMEVPTTAAYIITVSVAGPILQEYGLPALETHLFIFWYALLSTITPPVCGTVFIAAGMAETHWLKVASKAMRLGIGLYIIPLAFVTNRYLIHPETDLLLSLLSFAKITLGLAIVSYALVSDTRGWGQRIGLLIVGLLATIYPLF